MQEEKHSLILLYYQFLNAKTTQSVKRAQEKLKQYQENFQFIETNVSLLESPTVQTKIKKLIVIEINRFVKFYILRKNQFLVEKVLPLYKKLLGLSQIEFELKPLIAEGLFYILKAKKNNEVRQNYMKELINLAKTVSLENNQNFNRYTYLIFFAHTILLCSQQRNFIIAYSLGSFVSIAAHLQSLVTQDRQIADPNAKLILQLVKQYSCLIRKYFQILVEINSQVESLLFLPELVKFMESGLQLKIVNNSLNSLFFAINVESKDYSKLINQIKRNYLHMLSNFILLVNKTKNTPNTKQTNQLYLKLPLYLDNLIRQTLLLLTQIPFNKLPEHIYLAEILNQIFNLLNTCIADNQFYAIILKHKSALIQKLIMPSLDLSASDKEDFYNNPTEFIERINVIKNKNQEKKGQSIYMLEESQQIKDQTFIKSSSAELLFTLCQFQDGTLTYVCQTALKILNKQIQTNFNNSLMYLVLTILNDQIAKRKDILDEVIHFIIRKIQESQIVIADEESSKQYEVQFAYFLLFLDTFIRLQAKTDVLFQKVLNFTFKNLNSSLNNQIYSQFLIQILTFVFLKSNSTQIRSIIFNFYNNLLAITQNITKQLLKSYLFVIQQFKDETTDYSKGLLLGLKSIVQLLIKYTQNFKQNEINSNYCWNAINQISNNLNLIQNNSEQIELILSPLIDYIDETNNFNFQQSLLQILMLLLIHTTTITQFQISIIRKMPLIFYHMNRGRFCFITKPLLLLIQKGSKEQIQNSITFYKILQMCLFEIRQSFYKDQALDQYDSCIGVMILHCLILKYPECLSKQNWSQIIKTSKTRLHGQIINQFLSANLIGLLCLSVLNSHNYFSNSQNQIIVGDILIKLGKYQYVAYACKVIVISLTSILSTINMPFVYKFYAQILNRIIEVIEKTEMNNYTEDEDEEYIEYNMDKEMYLGHLKQQISNRLMNTDQFLFFRQQFQKIKKNNSDLIKKIIDRMTKEKKDFLQKILATEIVQKQPRVIHKIKHSII